MTALTAVTAQNTRGVTAVHEVPPEIVSAQVHAVLSDIGVDAVKIGMLGTVQVTLAVARLLDELDPGTPVVLDPVMVAESGARLLDTEAQQALIYELLPRTTVLTPNLPEARVLANRSPDVLSQPADSAIDDTDDKGEELARALLALGPQIVVLTGGHRRQAVDLFVDSHGHGEVLQIHGKRHPDGASHGSGCTHSSILAAQLALGHTPLQAARIARELAGAAVANGLRDVGVGAGPVDVFGLDRLRGQELSCMSLPVCHNRRQ